MLIEFIGKPYTSGKDVVEKLNAAIEKRGTRHVWMITQIAEGTSLQRLTTGLEALRSREGMSEAIITIAAASPNGAGLVHATKVIDRRLAIPDLEAHRTGTYFYVAEANQAASVLIGPPGLPESPDDDIHIGGYWIDLDLGDEADSAFLDRLREYYDAIADTPDLCRLMGDDYVPELVAASVQPLKELPPLRASGERTGVNGFFKRLSRNDASLTDSPGQMIIPRRFLSFFPEMEESMDNSATGGSRQRSCTFPLTYLNGEKEIEVPGARAMLYVPAQGHKRRNPELRFTFRNREILEEVDEGDILVFTRLNGRIVVERKDPDWVPPGAKPTDKFGQIE